MLKKTQGILLRRFKYGDNSKIAHIYTRDFGKQSYMIFNGKSPQKKTDRLLQPMYVLDFHAYYKANRELNKIKDISPAFPIKSIPFDFKKTALCQYAAELVNKTQRENEADELLYGFLKSTVQILDDSSQSLANFSAIFAVKYSKFLGLQPDNNYSPVKNTFDLHAGRFITGRPHHKDFLPPDTAAFVFELTQIPFTDFNDINIPKIIRRDIINGFIRYFNYHLGKPGKLNSSEILAEVFS